MTAIDVAHLFEKQIARRTGIKTILAPSSLKESGPHVKVLVRKVLVPARPAAAQGQHELRLYVSLEGKLESDTGLKMALDDCESLAVYILTTPSLHLEDETGKAIANTLITAKPDENDGLVGDPDDDKVAWADDLIYVSVFYPAA
jgi:hypothetical protein